MNQDPAEDDITDTDDGDTRISAGAFWPDIVLRELRLAVRLPGRVTTSRLLHTATGPWLTLPANWKRGSRNSRRLAIRRWPMFRHPVINGESVNLWHWRNAVYTATRALILERTAMRTQRTRAIAGRTHWIYRHRICGAM
ncbi:Head completion/stabilization protein L [Escherichia coli]|uniref:Head completion/stabilization protein L n=1 Tax=Escherichia coli TaxID=562 RepID=A0A3S4NWA9_ECOLX|nr:Head completion/stabilization protein L [Escherichia coli]